MRNVDKIKPNPRHRQSCFSLLYPNDCNRYFFLQDFKILTVILYYFRPRNLLSPSELPHCFIPYSLSLFSLYRLDCPTRFILSISLSPTGVTWSLNCSPLYLFICSYFACATRLVGSQSPTRNRTPGLGSESVDS